MRRIRVDGTFIGPRQELERLVDFVSTHDVRPHIGARVEGLRNLKLAYARGQQGRHVGKCTIHMS